MIGRQPPQLWSARFTADGKRLVYTYDVVTILQYERKGGATRSSGIRKGHMNVRDALTGGALLDKPYRSKNTLHVVAIEGDLCALEGYDTGTSRHGLYIMDITTGEERFTPDELSKLNGGLEFNASTQYVNTTGKPGFVFAADDARAYLIDPKTGRAELAEVAKPLITMFGNKNPTSLGSKKEVASFTDGPRQRLEMNGRGSTLDFISPAFAGGLRDGESERIPMTYQGNPIIISHSSTKDDFGWEITMLDAGTLNLMWSASLVNIPRAAPFYWEEPLFMLNGEELLVQTATQLSRFDAASGKLFWTVEVP